MLALGLNFISDNTIAVFFSVLAVILAAVITGGVLMIRALVRKRYDILSCTLAAFLCIFTAVLSYIFCFGWIRLFTVMLLIPVIYAIFFFFVMYAVSKYIMESRFAALLVIVSCITYVAANVFLPDFGDNGGMYAVFGLVCTESDELIFTLLIVSIATFVANIACNVGMIVVAVTKSMQKRLERKTEAEFCYSGEGDTEMSRE